MVARRGPDGIANRLHALGRADVEQREAVADDLRHRCTQRQAGVAQPLVADPLPKMAERRQPVAAAAVLLVPGDLVDQRVGAGECGGEDKE